MFADFNNDQNNDDFLDEFRQKLNTEPSENFEERKNEINRSKNVFIGTVSGIALAAVVGWFVLSPRYASDNNAELPVIRRPQTAVKVQPAEPGGMEIHNQDKSVYDIIEKKDDSNIKVEKLLPAPEEPQLPTVTAFEEIETPAAEQAKKIIETSQTEENSKSASTVPTQEVKKAAGPQVAPAEPAVKEATTVAEVKTAVNQPAQVDTPKELETPKQQPDTPVATSAPIPTTQPAAPEVKKAETAQVAIVKGPWQVQLLSSPNRKAIDSSWTGLVKKYPMLEGQPREIETADLGSKGTFYRLKVGGFADRNGADRLCNDIKALGGTCIVKKK